MSERPYTDADVAWLAEVLWSPLNHTFDGAPTWSQFVADSPQSAVAYRQQARAVLDALTAAGWMRGHCPGCECPDVPYDGAPPTHRLVIAPEEGEQQ